jgi:hypothetical protein
LLVYLGERSLRSPGVPIREYEIGVELFNRAVNYDTSQDTLVRVQASHLRKKLLQYFLEEGKDETLIVDLPKGGYTLCFRPRESELDVLTIAPAGLPFRSRWFIAMAAVSALLAAATVLLLIQNSTLRRRSEFGLGPKPSVDAFWAQVFGNGLHNYLVVADGNLVVFEDAIHRNVTLQEYQGKAFDRLAQQYISDPDRRALMLNLLRQYTSMADASLARRVSLVAASNELPLELVFARDMTIGQISSHNTILLGSRRANPWVNLFEEKLNFQTVFEESPKQVWFSNKSPKQGEQAAYRGRWGLWSYCRVALLPNPKSTGSVLLISGTDVQATEAGGDFVTRENWILQLRALLGLKGGEPIPHFEVLLQGGLVNNTLPQFQISAWRRY